MSIPVFAQAPLVRHAPWISLILSLGWLGISGYGISDRSPRWMRDWGHLLYGFTWTWLAGSIYWGWLRTEPLWHLPVEAIGLPVAIWGLWQGWARIGHYFFLGSFLGTAVTDLYIHLVGLLPEWREVMQAPEFEQAGAAFYSALSKMQTPWGMSWALILSSFLLWVGLGSLLIGWQRGNRQRLHWWTFSGAVLSTLVVDSLFWIGGILLAQ